ncbi:response regulator [Halorubrum ezzemoulense]|uniref:ATP-binding response regulator n=1 Tax=Halorubrum ezzemoulense TaxID=337243 RepID=UPI00232C2AEB|nr:response regulator [Halorubrum ezzemoulense]MDB2224838.1 response regulator [Halorubrum ezzemoulense]
MNSEPGDASAGTGAAASDAPGSNADSSRCVLFVDDEPGAADLAATHVDRLVDGIETLTRLSPDEGLEVVRDGRVDCVVSDFDMPGSNGLEFLESVRDVDPGLPFVLFTGKGSEEIASDAISAGVTDYLQKGAGRDRYEMLANSVANALGRRRAERDLREVNAKVTAIHEFAAELASVTDVATVFDRTVDDIEPVPLDEAAERAWRTVDTAGATLDASAATDAVDADPERLRTLLENLFTNSVEHGSTSSRATPDDGVEHGSDDADDLTISVGSLPDGFYVADDGRGFDIDPEAATEYGRSSTPDGTGFGLAIVREIAAAHGWELSVDDRDGARFEFRPES